MCIINMYSTKIKFGNLYNLMCVCNLVRNFNSAILVENEF